MKNKNKYKMNIIDKVGLKQKLLLEHDKKVKIGVKNYPLYLIPLLEMKP